MWVVGVGGVGVVPPCSVQRVGVFGGSQPTSDVCALMQRQVLPP